MNSIENYKIFHYQIQNELENQHSIQYQVQTKCSVFFKDRSKILSYVVYSKTTDEISKHNLKVKSDLCFDFAAEFFQDDFVFVKENFYFVNINCQDWIVLLTLPENKQFLQDFYLIKRKIQAQLENNEVKKIFKEIKSQYSNKEHSEEIVNEQVYFDTEQSTEQNRKIIDKFEEEQAKLKNRKRFLKVLVTIGVLAFLALFFGVLCNESYFQKIEAKSLFKKRNVFTWNQTKNKKETQTIEKLRKNLFIEDKGTKNSKKILKKGKRHQFQKTNFDF